MAHRHIPRVPEISSALCGAEVFCGREADVTENCWTRRVGWIPDLAVSSSHFDSEYINPFIH